MSLPPDAIGRRAGPLPHPNLLVGSVQILAWLFFRPAVWRRYVARCDPALDPDFALIDLTWAQWRSPAVRRLVLQSCGLWMILLLGAVGMAFVLAMDADGIDDGVSAVVAIAFFCAFLPAAPLVAGVLVGVVCFTAALPLGDMWAYSTSTIAVGVMGSLLGQLRPRSPGELPAQHVGALVIAAALGLLTAGVVPGLLLIFGGVRASPGRDAAFGAAMGLICGAVILLRLGRWSYALLAGGAVGLAVALSNHVADIFQAPPGAPLGAALYGLTYGIIYGVGYSSGFTIAAPLARRTAGAWAGNAAAILVFAILRMLDSLPTGAPLWSGLLAGAGLCLGLMFYRWRPLLLYPFQAAWNTLLFRADERRARGPWALRWHAAFWDDLQWLPLGGLDLHLVLVAERDPAAGQEALEALAHGRQRWAAQAAQIELDARRLERCADAAGISAVVRYLGADELDGPASALLRSFSRVSQDAAAALAHTTLYHQRLGLHAVEERLDGLLRELTRSSERYAGRFQPIAGRWRQIVAARSAELAAASEQHQELVSPYIVGVPLTAQQAIFVGRADISARIEQLLRAEQCPPLLLYGQRRMGKTSLLNNLGRLLPRAIVPLLVDLQGPLAQASDHAAFLGGLARAMGRSAQRQRGLHLPALAPEDVARDPFLRFDAWLDAVEERLGDQTALLLLDEFEALNRAFAGGRLEVDAVLGFLRHLIQHRPRLKVLLAGSHALEEVQRWASYLINVQVLPIGYLQEDEARQLIERPTQDFALRYEADAPDLVLGLTRGHPALVQLLCAEIVGLKNSEPVARRRTATCADVEAAVPEALRRGSFFFLDIEHNQIDAAARAVLSWIAGQGPGAVAASAELERRFPADLAAALAQLRRRELIEAAQDGYRVQVELIRRWFADRREPPADLPPSQQRALPFPDRPLV
jgi:hypothetical protein